MQYNQGGADYTIALNDYIYTYSGVPAYGYTQLPYKQNGQMKNLGAYFDDTFRVCERFTLNLGARFDHSKGFLPAADILDRDANPTGEKTAAIDKVFAWDSFSPRVGFSWKLNKSGHSVLKGHYGRYYRGVITGEFDNTADSVSARYRFSGTYDGQGNPEGASKVSDNTNLSVDPNYKNPYTDQFIGELSQELGKDLALSVGYIYKRGANYGGFRDVGGVYEPAVYLDNQGTDATNQPIAVLSLVSDPADRLFLLTNPSELHTRYNGGTLTLNKRMSHHWQMVTSLVISKSEGRIGSSRNGLKSNQSASAGTFGQNPNDFVNTDGRLIGDRPLLFKTQLVYQAPWGLLFGLNFVHQTGRPFARTVRVGDVTNIAGTILAEKVTGDRRVPDWNIVDLNVQKQIKLGGPVSLELFVYLLNLTNSGIYEDVLDRLGARTEKTFPH